MIQSQSGGRIPGFANPLMKIVEKTSILVNKVCFVNALFPNIKKKRRQDT